MTVEVSFPGDSDDEPRELADESASAPARSSVLGAIAADRERQLSKHTKTLPVGRSTSLRARYRVLSDDEINEIDRRVEQARKQLQRTSRDDGESAKHELQRLADSHLLVAALEELHYVDDDGTEIPLGDALAGDGVDAPPRLRYDRDLARLLGLADEFDGTPFEFADPERPTQLEIVRALHSWGDGTTPLRSHAQVLRLWMSGLRGDLLGETLEGN